MRPAATEQARLAELFVSVQGEGPLVGVRQVFVRLAGCARAARGHDVDLAALLADEMFGQVGNETRGRVSRPLRIRAGQKADPHRRDCTNWPMASTGPRNGCGTPYGRALALRQKHVRE